MTFRALIPYLAAGLAALVIVVCAAAFLLPALRDGKQSVTHANEDLPRILARLPTLAGESYARESQNARRQAEDRLEKLEAEFHAQRDQLHRPFPPPGGGTTGEPLSPAEFRHAYAFSQDELVREIALLVRRVSGREITAIPLIEPAFQTENRDPTDENEIRGAQRAFNLQGVLLRQAATKGAWAIAPPHFLEATPAWDQERRFVEIRATLRLAVEEHLVPKVLRALLELDLDGPIMRLAGLAIRPHPLPKLLTDTEELPIELEVRLAIYEFTRGEQR